MKIGLKKSKKQANPAVKGGDMGAPKFDLKNISRKRLFAYIGLALLVVASVAWLILSDTSTINEKNKSAEKSSENTVVQKEEDKTDEEQLNNLKESVDSIKSVDEKSVVLVKMSVFSSNTNNLQDALNYAVKAEETKPTALTAAAIADAAMDLKDYKKAAEYYGIAASRSEKPSSPSANMPYNDYIRMQKEAQAKL